MTCRISINKATVQRHITTEAHGLRGAQAPNPAMDKPTMCRPRVSQRDEGQASLLSPPGPSLDHMRQSAYIACCGVALIGWTASIVPFSKPILSLPVRLDAILRRTGAFRGTDVGDGDRQTDSKVLQCLRSRGTDGPKSSLFSTWMREYTAFL